MALYAFESLVNTEGFKTALRAGCMNSVFESLVNTEGFKTARKESARHL